MLVLTSMREADRQNLPRSEKFCFRPELAGWNISFVIRKPQKRCPLVIDYLVSRHLAVAVDDSPGEGAYWNSEIGVHRWTALKSYRFIPAGV